MKKIVLASKSERRKELLGQIGIRPVIDESKIDENKYKFSSPVKLVETLSKVKAKAVSQKYKDAIIIGADTIVVLGNEIIGKPTSLKDAVKILKKLSGKPHLVITGFTVLDTKTKKSVTKAVKTRVIFKKLSEEEIKAYVYSSKVLDKAGAYAIQDKAGMFITGISGDYFNIVGLPIFKLSESLKEFGIDVSSSWKKS